jgi:hypothetical protein
VREGFLILTVREMVWVGYRRDVGLVSMESVAG